MKVMFWKTGIVYTVFCGRPEHVLYIFFIFIICIYACNVVFFARSFFLKRLSYSDGLYIVVEAYVPGRVI